MLRLSSLQRGKCRKSVILYAILSDKIVVASHAGDPLIHYGRHFSRTVHAMCNVQVLLTQGVDRLASTEVVAEESLTLEYILVVLVSIISGLMHLPLKHRARRGRQVFDKLCRIVPRFSDRLLESEEWQVIEMAELVCLLMILNHSLILQRFRRAYRVQGPMIPRV